MVRALGGGRGGRMKSLKTLGQTVWHFKSRSARILGISHPLNPKRNALRQKTSKLEAFGPTG